jgi:hypothetical protein
MTEVVIEALDPRTAIGTGPIVAASPPMQLGVLTRVARTLPVQYDFGDPLIGMGGASTIMAGHIVVGTQWFPEAYMQEAALARAAVRQLAAERLATRLESESAHLSVIRRSARNPTFVQLQQLGSAALTTALRRLGTGSRPLWLYFLQRTASAHPACDAESLGDAVDAWRGWGKTRGLI